MVFLIYFILMFVSSVNAEQIFSNRTYAQSAVTEGPLLFSEDFEGDKPFSLASNVKGIRATSYAFMTVDEPVFRGKKAGRFELRYSDPIVSNGKRAEVSVVGSSNHKERWYSFAVFFPAEHYAYDSENEIISQWHQSPDRHLGEGSQSPATALRIRKDRFILDTGYNENKVSDGVHKDKRKRIDLGIIEKNVWHEFVFHFVHSYEKDGLIEVWHNGKHVLTHKGGNMYNNVKLPYWKLGVYKAIFKRGPTDVEKRILYYDNIRVGNENATFEVMSPSSW
jgi:hypothetical protein